MPLSQTHRQSAMLAKNKNPSMMKSFNEALTI